jgi:hypothetical protein
MIRCAGSTGAAARETAARATPACHEEFWDQFPRALPTALKKQTNQQQS